MRILIIADEESKSLWDHYSPEKLDGIDLIVSCGDLKAEYLEFLVTMCHAPLLYVPGNHDSRYAKHPSGARIINGYEKYILELGESDRASLTRREISSRLLWAFR